MPRNAEEGVELPMRRDHLRSIFDKYDFNGDGRIELHELHNIIRSGDYAQDIPPHVVNQIMAMSDTDNNGYLDFEEFVKMVHNPILKSIFGRYLNKYVNNVIPKRRGGASRSTDVIDGQYEEEYSFWPPPVWMILISLVEIVLFCIDASAGHAEDAKGPIAEIAIYDPKKRSECWRFVTYMFVHIGVIHLVVNLLVQLLLGFPLEMVHQGWRVLFIYFCGVLAGSLGTSITDPSVKLAGASGGVYALITAHIASVIMNWHEMQFAVLHLVTFFFVYLVDLGTAIYNRYTSAEDHIGYTAHICGSVAGLLVGIFVLRNLEVNSLEKKLWWISLIVYISLMSAAILWNVFRPEIMLEDSYYSNYGKHYVDRQ